MMRVRTGEGQPRKTYYICNRQRCENCAKDCHYTLDEYYALYNEHEMFDIDSDGNKYEVPHGKGVR